MTNKKSSINNAADGWDYKKTPASEKTPAGGLRLRTAVRAGKVTLQDILISSY